VVPGAVAVIAAAERMRDAPPELFVSLRHVRVAADGRAGRERAGRAGVVALDKVEDLACKQLNLPLALAHLRVLV
jgi:hypothetical protein